MFSFLKQEGIQTPSEGFMHSSRVQCRQEELFLLAAVAGRCIPKTFSRSRVLGSAEGMDFRKTTLTWIINFPPQQHLLFAFSRANISVTMTK